jgi:WD40 repeat protein
MGRTAAEDRLVRACRRAKDHTQTPAAVESLLPRLKQLIDTAPTGTYSPDASGDTWVDGGSEAAHPAVAAGSTLGPFLLLEVLGRGGMGVVFRARDPRLEREVAVKVIRPELAARPGIVERFRREARAAAAVEDDHILGVYEVGEEVPSARPEGLGGVPYLAMPLLRGESLEARLRSAPGGLPLIDLLRIAREAAVGLAAAHRHGLVHRDIKPSNLWLEEARNAGRGARREGKPAFGRVKLLDFGLAGAVDSGGKRDVSGTPAYMAPEQARGLPTDGRSDLFSLGVVLYQMATGVLPFAGPDARAVLLSVVADEPAPASKLNSKLPRRLDSLIRALLAKKPDDRPATAEAVAREIEAIERDLRPRRWWLAATALAATGGVGVAGYLLRSPQAPAAPLPGEVTFDVGEGPGEVAVRDADGAEVARLAAKSGRTITLPAGHYTITYSDAATKLHPWPGAFEVTAGRGLTVTIRPVGEVARYTGHTGGVNAVAFLSGTDLRNVSVAGGDFKPVIWGPAAQGKPVLLPALGAEPLCVAVSPGGAAVAVGDGGRQKRDNFEARVFKLPSGEVLRTFDDHDDHVTALAFTPDGGRLLTGLRDGRLLVHPLATGKSTELSSHRGPVRSIAVSPATNRAVAAWGDPNDHFVAVWDLAKMQPVKEWTPPAEVKSAAIFPDGSAGVVAGADGVVHLWSVAEGAAREFKGHDGPVLAVAVSADGSRILSGGADGTVRLWDVHTGAEIIRERHKEKTSVSAVALAADGRHALSGGTDKTVRLWKLPE